MFIHIGERNIVSDKAIIGIFNVKTLEKSPINDKYLKKCDFSQRDIKTIVIDNNNEVILSKVSSFTVIKRTTLDEKDCVWSNK
ncbi:MAG: extracellular matrix regulator RemB [Bacteroidales bacterium]